VSAIHKKSVAEVLHRGLAAGLDRSRAHRVEGQQETHHRRAEKKEDVCAQGGIDNLEPIHRAQFAGLDAVVNGLL
jgi:hypothetical protein